MIYLTDQWNGRLLRHVMAFGLHFPNFPYIYAGTKVLNYYVYVNDKDKNGVHAPRCWRMLYDPVLLSQMWIRTHFILFFYQKHIKYEWCAINYYIIGHKWYCCTTWMYSARYDCYISNTVKYQRLNEIRVWIRNYNHAFLWDIITHSWPTEFQLNHRWS